MDTRDHPEFLLYCVKTDVKRFEMNGDTYAYVWYGMYGGTQIYTSDWFRYFKIITKTCLISGTILEIQGDCLIEKSYLYIDDHDPNKKWFH